VQIISARRSVRVSVTQEIVCRYPRFVCLSVRPLRETICRSRPPVCYTTN
jgi:hypothetical protein